MCERICVFGDSITRGYYDLKMGGWANRLWLEVLKISDLETSLYNCGISGDTTEKLLNRLEVECRAIEPTVIMIALGINDSYFRKSLNGNRVSLEKFQSNLNEIFSISKKFAKQIIIIEATSVQEKETTPTEWDSDLYYYNENIIKYNNVLKNFAQENQLLLIPMFDLLSEGDYYDGLHPNADGHEKIYQRVKECLLKNKII